MRIAARAIRHRLPGILELEVSQTTPNHPRTFLESLQRCISASTRRSFMGLRAESGALHVETFCLFPGVSNVGGTWWRVKSQADLPNRDGNPSLRMRGPSPKAANSLL